jgi:hypothetical protein
MFIWMCIDLYYYHRCLLYRILVYVNEIIIIVIIIRSEESLVVPKDCPPVKKGLKRRMENQDVLENSQLVRKY